MLKKVTEKQWSKVDWSNRDADIARSLNVSRERVRQIRLKLEKPKYNPSAVHKELVSKAKNDIIKAIKLEPLTSNLTREGIRRLLKLDVSNKVLTEASKGILQPLKWPTDHFEWRLPNSFLESIWGCPFNLPGNVRSEKGIGKAKWDQRFNNQRDSKLFNTLHEIEEEKVKRWNQLRNK